MTKDIGGRAASQSREVGYATQHERVMAMTTSKELQQYTERAQALADSGDPVKGVKAVSAIAGKGAKIMVESALTMWAAVKTGATNGELAAAFGKSTSTVTLYRRGGSYLIAGGVPDSDQWKVLMSKSKANTDKVIRGLLDAPTVDLDAVNEHIAATYDPTTGKPLVPATREPQTPDGEAPPLEQALAFVRALRDLFPKLDREAFAKVETAVTEAVGESIKARVNIGDGAPADGEQVLAPTG